MRDSNRKGAMETTTLSAWSASPSPGSVTALLRLHGRQGSREAADKTVAVVSDQAGDAIAASPKLGRQHRPRAHGSLRPGLPQIYELSASVRRTPCVGCPLAAPQDRTSERTDLCEEVPNREHV